MKLETDGTWRYLCFDTLWALPWMGNYTILQLVFSLEYKCATSYRRCAGNAMV